MTEAGWGAWIAGHQTLLLAGVFVVLVALYVLRSMRGSSEEVLDLSKVGDITLEELAKYSGADPFRATLLAVRGVIFDVSTGRDFYGPKGAYEVFAGKEVARALGKMSKDKADCTADLKGLSDTQMETLCDWEVKFRQKYPVVGSVAPSKRLSLKELRHYDGSDPKLPMLLAIRGTIFDISSGKEFYGPDGMYPFAGHECARAFALVSTDTKDCTDDLQGLQRMELDSLRDWEARFYSKYPIVGSVVA